MLEVGAQVPKESRKKLIRKKEMRIEMKNGGKMLSPLPANNPQKHLVKRECVLNKGRASKSAKGGLYLRAGLGGTHRCDTASLQTRHSEDTNQSKNVLVKL